MNTTKFKIRLGSRIWFFRFVKSKEISSDAYGDSDSALAHPQIRVRQALRGQTMLDVIIHEGLHASRPELAEEAVTETASDIARLLWKVGYRLREDK